MGPSQAGYGSTFGLGDCPGDSGGTASRIWRAGALGLGEPDFIVGLAGRMHCPGVRLEDGTGDRLSPVHFNFDGCATDLSSDTPHSFVATPGQPLGRMV